MISHVHCKGLVTLLLKHEVYSLCVHVPVILILRGFAFVHFNEELSVHKVLEAGEHTLDERTIDVKKAIPHAQHQVCPSPIH